MPQTPIHRRGLLRAAGASAAAAAALGGLALPAVRRAAADAAPAARLSLLHVNDFHSRHEAVGATNGVACRAGPGDPASANACLGGSARLVAAMRAERAAAEAEGRASLALDIGDQFMGSLFYTHHRGLAEAAVMRAWGCEVMALGNHEFDHGPETLAAFARAYGGPILAANLDAREEPALRGLVRPWMRVDRGGARLALIGLVPEETPLMASPGPRLRFEQAEAAVERAVAEIRAAEGGAGPVTVLLLSHLGLGADLRLAARVPGVDAILGGHSHTLLANELPGAEGPHPVMADGPDRPVRIVQAGSFGRWLGRLDLDLGADGRVLAHGRAGPRPLAADLPEDPEAAALVARFAAPLEEARRRAVATTAAAFGNEDCRREECALGNLLAESMLAAVPGAEIAVVNGGGIRSGLPAGTVTYGDLLSVLPFGNTLASFGLRGADLLAALENGLSRPGAGRFLQFAGLRIAWSPEAPPGSRLISAEVAEAGAAGGWAPLDPARVYRVLSSDFLRRGGDGYVTLRDRAIDPYDAGPALEEVLAAYLTDRGPLAPRLDGRIAAR